MRATMTAVAATASLKPWANPAGLFAADSGLCAARAACDIFGIPEPPELDALKTEVLQVRAAEAKAAEEGAGTQP
jgi:hypothetical protein